MSLALTGTQITWLEPSPSEYNPNHDNLFKYVITISIRIQWHQNQEIRTTRAKWSKNLVLENILEIWKFLVKNISQEIWNPIVKTVSKMELKWVHKLNFSIKFGLGKKSPQILHLKSQILMLKSINNRWKSKI